MVIFVWEVRMLAWGRNKVSEAISRGRAKGVGWLPTRTGANVQFILEMGGG